MDEVEGSHPGSSSFFVGTTRQLQLDSSRRKRFFSKKMKNDVDREDAKTRERERRQRMDEPAGERGMDTRSGSVRFEDD